MCCISCLALLQAFPQRGRTSGYDAAVDDRTPEQNALFFQALSVMGDLYASAVGTTVLQLKEIPTRPESFDGAVALFDLADGVDEAKIKDAFSAFGVVKSVEITGTWSPAAIVRLATHDDALAAVKAGAPKAICGGIDTLYNKQSYDGRRGEEGLDDDFGRGWCTFERAMSRLCKDNSHAGEEYLLQLGFPAVLPHKVRELGDDHPLVGPPLAPSAFACSRA